MRLTKSIANIIMNLQFYIYILSAARELAL